MRLFPLRKLPNSKQRSDSFRGPDSVSGGLALKKREHKKMKKRTDSERLDFIERRQLRLNGIRRRWFIVLHNEDVIRVSKRKNGYSGKLSVSFSSRWLRDAIDFLMDKQSKSAA